MKKTLLFLLISTSGTLSTNPSFAMEEQDNPQEKFAALKQKYLGMEKNDFLDNLFISGNIWNGEDTMRATNEFQNIKPVSTRGRGGRGGRVDPRPSNIDIHFFPMNADGEVRWQVVQSYWTPKFYPKSSSDQLRTSTVFPWKELSPEDAPYFRVVKTYEAQLSLSDATKQYKGQNGDYYLFPRTTNRSLVSAEIEHLDRPYEPIKVSLRKCSINEEIINVKERFDIRNITSISTFQRVENQYMLFL